MKFYELDKEGAAQEEYGLSPEGDAWMIAPQQWHEIEPLSDDSEMQLGFYCTVNDYFSERHGISATHSAMRTAEGIMPAGKTLNIGCGQGRNVLLPALKGFDVTAVDNDPYTVQNVVELAWTEDLPVRAFEYDLNAAHLQDDFNCIAATVVFMFLRPQSVPQIIADMQARTNPGSYNLIVLAVDTTDFPYPMSSLFKFGGGELRGYYQDWQLVEYKEELGSMRARDEAGNPIRFKFVTVLARESEQGLNGQRPSETGFSDGPSIFR